MTSRPKDGRLGSWQVGDGKNGGSTDTLYALGMVSAANYGLATGPNRIGQRLGEAYTMLSHVHRNHLPASLRAEFDWIMDRLSSVQAPPAWNREKATESADSVPLAIDEAVVVEVARHMIALESRLEIDRSLEDGSADRIWSRPFRVLDWVGADPVERPTTAMDLGSFFSADAISLHLKGTENWEILKELITLLKLDAKSEAELYKMLRRRESLGSTGIGQGIAIPHCRAPMVNRLRVAFARKPEGVDFNAMDQKPVYNFFLIVAPAKEYRYMSVLGRIAQFAKEPDVPGRLAQLETPKQFLELLNEKTA